MNKQRQWRKTVLVIAVLICLILFVVLLLTGNGKTKKIQSQLELGERYMSELNYEQAIATYEQILQIDDKCVDAYLGVTKAYIAIGDYDAAKDILERGYSLVRDDRIQDELNDLQNMQEKKGPEQTLEEIVTEEVQDARF